MIASYYDALLPVGELGDDDAAAIAGLRLPVRVLASVVVPSDQVVVALVSDDSRLGRMFAENWAPAAADQEPDATLYALAGPACSYGFDEALDGARWWSRGGKTMVVFGIGSYRLAKVCIRGICSAVSGDDILFLHGCALSIGAGGNRRGVVVSGSSGAGKTTAVAKLLAQAEYPVTVLNDDWGAVSLSSGNSVNTGERRLHMKAASVLALRPDFFTRADRGSYSPDLSEPGRAARILVSPEAVYRRRWDTRFFKMEHLVVIVREPPGWTPPRRGRDTVSALKGEPGLGSIHHHEPFFNGSLLLGTAGDEQREERRYRRLLDRVAVSWINNCGSAGKLAANFISAVMK